MIIQARIQHLAYHYTLGPLRQIIHDDPSSITRLAECCRLAVKPRLALQSVGLWDHPSIRRLRHEFRGRIREFSRTLRPQVVRILFHADHHTLYQDLPNNLYVDGSDA